MKFSSQEYATQLIRQNINTWKAQSKTLSDFMEKYANGAYLNNVAPGRNRAVYIIGHLVSASDDILLLFGLGERLYPELQEIFSTSPDGAHTDIPSIGDLRHYWKVINDKLAIAFESFSEETWMDRHTRVSEADFSSDRSRNKSTVLLSRTNHISYHMGQLNLLTV